MSKKNENYLGNKSKEYILRWFKHPARINMSDAEKVKLLLGNLKKDLTEIKSKSVACGS